MEVLKYESSEVKQGRTTNAALVGLHNLNILAADRTNGLPQGDQPLIVMKFKVIGPGFTPIVIKVDKIHDITGADIASKAVVKNGAVTATGTVLKTPTVTATVTTGATTVATTTTPAQTFTPLSTTPASVTTTLPTTTTVTTEPIASGPATVPFGTGVFSVTSIGNVPVGGIGTVQVVVDNAWQPPFADTYVDIKFDPSMVRYLTSSIHVDNTTAAARSDDRVRIMLGDFRNGYPRGRYPLADVSFTALREGTSTLTVSVDHVRYWSQDFTEFTDITATASGRSGVFSTGALPVETQPLVTFTQNTLAPVSYPVNDIDAGFASTTQTTTAATTAPTTVETVATQPPATVVTTVEPSPSASQTLNSSYAPVSTRVQSSGFPLATVVVVSLAILAGAALFVRRRG